MRIFISYSSHHRAICERLQLALEANGRHQVFVDRAELAVGRSFDESLRKGIQECDLLLFLISPESVAAGSYALAELGMARARWRHPEGRVLPVKVAPTPMDAIPAYLRAVTILEPQGDLVAEVVAAVEAMRPPSWRGRWLAWVAAVIAVAVIGAGVGYTQWQARRAAAAEAARLLAAARQLCDAKDHALAWQRFEDLSARHSDRQSLQQVWEACGMRWLREIRVQVGKDTFTGIVNRVLPVLAEGAVGASGQRLADLLAHMGWADYLRERDGTGGLDPASYYQKALAAESSNVYAHAMWGHHLVARKELTEAGRQHFAAAVAGGRDREFVRKLQFAALLEYGSFASEIEAVRVAGEMRRNGEPVDDGLRERLWRVYASRLYMGDWRVQRPRFLAAMRDADAVATFLWLFPEDATRKDRRNIWRLIMASLEQAAGDRDAALSRYRALRDDLEQSRVSGSIRDATLEAIRQLGNN